MQDVDFEMKYEPGRDEADPLPIIGNNSTEKILKATIETEHAVVHALLKEETCRDTALRKLSSWRQQTSVVSLLQECVTLQGDWIIADSAHVSLLSVGLSVFRQQSSTSCTQHGFP